MIRKISAAFVAASIITASMPAYSANTEVGKGGNRQDYKIYVDKQGVMRRSDTNAEVSYYGTNYTVPFAHAYRALGYIGKDRKAAIDTDVAHMARLGFNGFRLHLWDAELADSLGNLQKNEHLDLLDYLIAALEKRGIDVILTAQTNFGNGYPERDVDTGAFTYDFPKCGIHEDPKAQKIQANYLGQLASHVNPYTGKSYAKDNAIIAMEINNEPCHTGTSKEVTRYIDKMAAALRKNGFDKPILYNVSHNEQVRDAYYNAKIDGTTYQWYPSGLVAGHERKGNFLPAVSEYAIPWKGSMKNYDKLARVVYEFDPGDILGSYLYPAIARTFRKEGFQWITQFAYDPTDIAAFNTEYQTHFLNLAYTPAKALSMMIAAEAAREIPRGSDFGNYPQNNNFGDFRVSYDEDLSEYNSPEKFYYTNNTATVPVSVDKLKHVAGHGSSPVVEYNGSGAYFLDETDVPGVWRLEVMPDIDLVNDPFQKPSLSKRNGIITYNKRPMEVKLPSLGEKFYFKGINAGNTGSGVSADSKFEITPGVYLLSSTEADLSKVALDSSIGNMQMSEYHAPKADKGFGIPMVSYPQFTAKDGVTPVEVRIAGDVKPDSVVVYPSDVSFWRKDNRLISLHEDLDGIFRGDVPASARGGDNKFAVVVYSGGKVTTYPAGVSGTPLDWDVAISDYYTSQVIDRDTPVYLLNPEDKELHTDVSAIPSDGKYGWVETMSKQPHEESKLLFHLAEGSGGVTVLRAYVGDKIKDIPGVAERKRIVYDIADIPDVEGITLSVVTKNGRTYSKVVKEGDAVAEGIAVVLDEMQAGTTYLIPEPFPAFMLREADFSLTPCAKAHGTQPCSGKEKASSQACANHVGMEDIEFVEISIPRSEKKLKPLSIHGIWIE